MTDAHKAALAEGRSEGYAVRRYLEALDSHRPKRGRKRNPDNMKRRLQQIEAELPTADPLKRLQLVQERLDLEQHMNNSRTTVDLSALEKDFISAAKGYSQRKGISYHAWRELGVAASVLKQAGIGRSAA